MKCNDDELLKNVIQHISDNHMKIIDDLCKAYMAELYQKNGTIKPGDFILFEQLPTFHKTENCMVRKYWFEPKEKK